MPLHSECGITETEFTYPIPADANCHQYDISVTAVNIVGRGEPATVTYTGLQTSMYVNFSVNSIVYSKAIDCYFQAHITRKQANKFFILHASMACFDIMFVHVPTA